MLGSIRAAVRRERPLSVGILTVVLLWGLPAAWSGLVTHAQGRARPMPAGNFTGAFKIAPLVRIVNPTSLAFAPINSSVAFPRGLFVGSAVQGARSSRPDVIHQVAFMNRTVFVRRFAVLPSSSDPMALEFPPPGNFSDLLYVSANNLDGNRRAACGGAILAVSPRGNFSVFVGRSSEPCMGSRPPSNKMKLGEPLGMTFGPYNTSVGLFVANDSALPADIVGIARNGSIQAAVDDGMTSGGLSPMDVEFGPGGGFGSDLYFSDADPGCNCIRMARAFGNYSLPFASFAGTPMAIEFGPGNASPFGPNLYVAVNELMGAAIYRVAPDGSMARFASGFGRFSSDALEFSRDGMYLFVADFRANAVWRVQKMSLASEGSAR